MKNIREIEGIKLEDAKIVKTNVFEDYARHLKKNKKELKEYKKHIVKKYNETGDTALFLDSLKIVAMAEGKISTLAKSAQVHRTSVYRILSKEANPSFDTVISFASGLGISFSANV